MTVRNERTDVMGVGFDSVTLRQAVDQGEALARGPGFGYVVTPNPEIVNLARRDESYREVLNGAALVLPDGIGVVKAAAILGRPLRERVPGIDFASGLMARLAANGGRLYLLGARPGVAEKAAANLAAAHPGLTVCGWHDGYFKEDGPVVEDIRASGADVVFVCLGFPKQERWMAQWGPETGAHLMAGLGGALDVFAGNARRAPEVWQKANLEWAYRLVHEPSRIGRMSKLPLFLVDALKERGREGRK